MSTSPIPPDPYEVLGVPKNCDIEVVKKAHRKLVLKFHPDRIKDPALQEQGKNEFQKVQQAYELLIDPQRKARYDDKVKLAELRRERMMNMNDSMSSARSTFSTTTYTARATPAAAASVRREMRPDGRFYEERTPETYFEPRPSPARDRYDDVPPRATARKSDSYEKRPSSSKNSEKKEKEKPKSYWDGPVKGMSMKMAFNLKKQAQAAKGRTKEDHARTAKARDKEEQRARNEKQAGSRYARVESESESDSDTVVPPRRPATREGSTRTRGVSSPESLRTRPPPPPRSRSYEEDESDSDETDVSKWERHHEDVRAYIAESQKRPPVTRSGSNAHVYWEKGSLKDHRRSGSDSDRRPSSSSKSSRRPGTAEARSRPAMPTQNSAPGNLKANIFEREPQRSKTSYPAESRPMPNLKRAETTPIPKSRKEGNQSRMGSNLKHTETLHDSGYGSSSSPHTPEMRGESPPPRDSRRKEKSTKYQIVDPLSDDDVRKPKLNKMHSDDDRPRTYNRSPDEMDDRRRERPTRPRVDTDMRTRSSRAPYSPVEGRPSFHGSPRDSPPVSRHNSGKLYGERSPDPDMYSRRVDPNSVRYATYRSPEDYDGAPGSHFNPNMGSRRPSLYT